MLFKIYSCINIGMYYFYNNSVFMKLENTDYLDSQWINKNVKILNINLCSKDRQKSYRFGHEGK